MSAQYEARSARVKLADHLLRVLSQNFCIKGDMEGRQHVTFIVDYLGRNTFDALKLLRNGRIPRVLFSRALLMVGGEPDVDSSHKTNDLLPV